MTAPLEPGATAHACPASTLMTLDELLLWRYLAEPDETVEVQQWCRLAEGHGGLHWAVGPDGFLRAGGDLPWWLRWNDDDTRHEMLPHPFCTATRPGRDTECSEPARHGAGHTWTHDPRGCY